MVNESHRPAEPAGRESPARDVLSSMTSQSKHESSRMWDVSFEMLASVREDGYLQQVNPRWEQILGWTTEELLGKPYLELIHPDDRQRTADEAARIFSGEGGASSFENRYRCHDGSFRWLVWNAVKSVEDDLIYAAAHDVTERKRQDLALDEARQKLQLLSDQLEVRVDRRTRELADANEELKAFSYSVSHDLRAPLRAIDGYSQALLEDYPDELPAGAVDDLNRVRAATQRMAAMIDEMLALSRVTTRELTRVPVDLSAIALEVADDLRRLDLERQVEIQIDPGLETVGDPILLGQVVHNLLENAWKFTAAIEDPVIEMVRTAADSGALEFEVRDNGAGFDMRYAEKLFRPFERLHRQDEYSGTGVGLTTVARILKRHGGDIRAVGVPAGGATFFVTIPAGDGAPDA